MPMDKAPIYTIKLPEYQVTTEPDHNSIGKPVDDIIKQHFMNETIVVRGVGSGEHDMPTDSLINIIQKTGTDRYDQGRLGDRYQNVENKQIDFFAFKRKMTSKTELFKDISWGFYHGSIAIHGRPVRIDIIIIYDSKKVKSVLHHYDGREKGKRDGFVFRDDDRKDAVRAIIKIV